MPYADNAAQRKYQREWKARRRREWFADKACETCGATEHLELDHVDPAQKVTHKLWTWSAARRETELAKCQVLCHDCHLKKTAAGRPRNHGRTLYDSGCRCGICVAAKRASNKKRAPRRARTDDLSA